MPASQPVQALLLFFQLGEREFRLGDFPVELGVELGAIGEELGPLGFPGGGVLLAEPGLGQVVLSMCVEEEQLTVGGTVDQILHLVDGLGGEWVGRQSPGPCGQGNRPAAA